MLIEIKGKQLHFLLTGVADFVEIKLISKTRLWQLPVTLVKPEAQEKIYFWLWHLLKQTYEQKWEKLDNQGGVNHIKDNSGIILMEYINILYQKTGNYFDVIYENYCKIFTFYYYLSFALQLSTFPSLFSISFVQIAPIFSSRNFDYV